MKNGLLEHQKELEKQLATERIRGDAFAKAIDDLNGIVKGLQQRLQEVEKRPTSAPVPSPVAPPVVATLSPSIDTAAIEAKFTKVLTERIDAISSRMDTMESELITFVEKQGTMLETSVMKMLEAQRKSFQGAINDLLICMPKSAFAGSESTVPTVAAVNAIAVEFREGVAGSWVCPKCKATKEMKDPSRLVGKSEISSECVACGGSKRNFKWTPK
jgi:Zn ribbon nucleic-acid-binding protein